MMQTLAKLENAIRHASSYQEFKEACIAHDNMSGADDWKSDDRSKDFDYRLIRKRVSRLKLAQSRNDILALMSCLHEGIHGNLGNISNPVLQQHCKIGTKRLIEEFIDAVCNALEAIYNADETHIDFYEKLSFFDETAHAYGQSCLMLSGGAGLGFFHAGVIKCLTEHKLLPNVISGASAGAILAAIVATRPDEKLLEELTPEAIYSHFNHWAKWKGLNSPSLFDSTRLENALIELFDLTTFEEAFALTEREVTITVSPADLHQHSRLLNRKTSPHAIITQAVRASCAIPYIFTPVKLKAKNPEGDVIPFIPNRMFADGSLMADLPFERLARLYGTNHSIVSQTNPLAVPFLSRTKRHSKSLSSIAFRHLANLTKMNTIFAFDMVESVTQNKGAKLGIHKLRSIVDQQYVGDINILPPRGFKSLSYLLNNPSIQSISELSSKAEKATWYQLDLIERSTRISQRFQYFLKKLKMRESRHFGHDPKEKGIPKKRKRNS